MTDITFVIDTSGSMGCDASKPLTPDSKPLSKMYLVQIILQYLLTQLFNMTDIKIKIIFFSSDSRLYECKDLNDSINEIYSVEANGSTNMRSAIMILGECIAKAFNNKRKHISLILTDGEFDAYSNEMADILHSKIKSLTSCPFESLDLNVVSIGEDSKIEILKKISDKFNGHLSYCAGQNTIQSVFSSFLIDCLLKFKNIKETKPCFDNSIIKTLIELINKNELPKARQEFQNWITLNPNHPINNIDHPDTKKTEADEIINSLKDNSTWRLHYLMTLYNQHENQICGNQLSPSLIPYLTTSFKEMYDEWKTQFLLLDIRPDPEEVKRKVNAEIERQRQQGMQVNYQQIQQRVSSSVQAPSTQNLVDAYGGCFGIDCFVKMETGYLKAGNVRKGMKLDNGAEVLWILRTNNAGNLYKNNELVITETHPIKTVNGWKPAKDVDGFKLINEKMDVVSFVLSFGNSIDFEFFQVASLGHRSTELGLYHHFYSFKVVNYIKELSKLQPESLETGIVISDPILFKEHYEKSFN